MRVHRIYFPDISVDTEDVTISGKSAAHLIKVLRVKTGHTVILFDGKGTEYQTSVSVIKRQTITLTISARNTVDRESPLDITLIQGISRGERMDWVLQKATELGVSKIVPVYTLRSLVTLDNKRLQSRMSHWLGIITHACEQCGRNTIPTLSAPQTLANTVTERARRNCYYLDANSIKRLNIIPQVQELNLIIGPEGGFAPEEKELMKIHNIEAVSMGPRILRTETAGIAALAAIGALWGDL